MPVLTGLSGTDGKSRECVFVRSVPATLKVLRSGLAATAAGDNGAINVWRDDDGNYRCEFQRFMSVKDSQIFRHLVSVESWLKEWLEKIK
jgi:hypothetical protein